MISYVVIRIFDLIYIVLLLTILLTWIPSIKWYLEPFKSLRNFSDIFLAPFRKIIPPIGMIDISPIVAFFCLAVIRNILAGVLKELGI